MAILIAWKCSQCGAVRIFATSRGWPNVETSPGCEVSGQETRSGVTGADIPQNG